MSEFDTFASTAGHLYSDGNSLLDGKYSVAATRFDATNGMPPAPQTEDNAPPSSGRSNAAQGNGEFDLSDEQAEQLLRELDLLGAQLQIMDHETRMLGTQTGQPATGQGGMRGSSGTGGIQSLTSSYSAGAVTPYRMQLAADQSAEESPLHDEALAQDAEAPSDLVDASLEDGTSRSRSSGRGTRRNRALFVPRKPTTAEALMAVDVSTSPVSASDLEPLELAAEPRGPIIPRKWMNSVSRFLNRSNSISEPSDHEADHSGAVPANSLLERSRTVGARPRPQSLMLFGAGTRRSGSIFGAANDQQPTRVDLATLAQSNAATTAAATAAAPTADKPRRARPYSMGFFNRGSKSTAAVSMNNLVASDDHDADVTELLRQMDALNQDLNANPKSVRMQNNSLQAGASVLMSLLHHHPGTTSVHSRPNRRNSLSGGGIGVGSSSISDASISSSTVMEEINEEAAQGALLYGNDGGSTIDFSRRRSASAYTYT